MHERIFSRLFSLFDVPRMQNNLRGLWAEAMVGELLGEDWRFTGHDWASWDDERNDGLRLEVKQSASQQSWGEASKSPRFRIAAPVGYHPDGKVWVENAERVRLADIYVFAWHEGQDQRVVSEWRFYVVGSDRLPSSQKTIGLSSIRGLAEPVDAAGLADRVRQIAIR